MRRLVEGVDRGQTTLFPECLEDWITEKCLPGLRRRIPTPHHVFRDRRLRDFEPEHQQLTVNPGRTPQWAFGTHPPDQVTKSRRRPLIFGRPALSLDFQRQNTPKPVRCHRRIVSG